MSADGSAASLPDKETRAPSRLGWLYIAAALLALIGVADGVYLTVEHLAGRTARCMVSSGCSKVLASPFATVAGIPLAALGAAAYFSVFSLATLAAYGFRHTRTLLSILVMVMFVMTLRLLYIQAFVLNEFCDYCLLSAAITLLLTAIVVSLNIFRGGR